MRKQKVLVVAEALPYPLDSGGKINLYKFLEILSEDYLVDLICFVDGREKVGLEEELGDICEEVEVQVLESLKLRYRRRLRELMLGLFSLKPFEVQRYYDERFKRKVWRKLRKGEYDYLVIDHMKMAQYLPEKKRSVWVLKEHELEHVAKWRIFLKEKGFLRKLYYLVEAVKFYFYEKRVVPKFDRWMAISEDDGKKLVELGAEEGRVWVERMRVESEGVYDFEESRVEVLFVGVLSWWPNKDAVEWFGDKVFPIVKQRVPEAKFVVVGERSGDVKRSLLDLKGVEFVGYVEELALYYKRARVFVVPIRAGRGVRIKVLNTMAAGVPVVSTKMGMEGIPAEQGEEVLVADRPEEFARHVVEALRNKSLAESLSEKGVRFIEKNYNLKKAKTRVRNLMSGEVRKR